MIEPEFKEEKDSRKTEKRNKLIFETIIIDNFPEIKNVSQHVRRGHYYQKGQLGDIPRKFIRLRSIGKKLTITSEKKLTFLMKHIKLGS